MTQPIPGLNKFTPLRTPKCAQQPPTTRSEYRVLVTNF